MELMDLLPLLTVRELLGAREAWKTLLGIQSDNLIGLWRLNETTGSDAFDSSPEGNDGAYTGVTLADAAGPDGNYIPRFDGVNDYVDIYSAGLNSDFNGAEGSAILWSKVYNAAVWEDSATRTLLKIQTDTNSYVEIRRSPTNNGLAWLYNAGGTLEYMATLGHSDLDYMVLGITWSATADQAIAYKNGSDEKTNTGLGTWDGALNSTGCYIGAASNVPIQVWNGWEGVVGLWKVPLSPTEMAVASGAFS